MINVEQVYDDIIVSYFNANGRISIEKIRIPESEKYNWVICSDNDPQRDRNFKSQNGKSVKKMHKNNIRLSKYRIYEFLYKKLSQESQDRIFSKHEPEKWFMDIETEVIDGAFPDVNIAKEKVLSYSLCNQKNDVYIIGLNTLTPIQQEELFNRVQNYFDNPTNYKPGYKPISIKFNQKYISYTNEAQMLADFYYKFYKNIPLLTGWNFLKFDIAFMNARAKRNGIDISKPSFTGNFYNLKIKDKYDSNKDVAVELPMHRSVVDYLEIFAKWDTSIKLKNSLALDTIALEVLGLPKLSYAGNLSQFYVNDYIGFLAYCTIDTILVKLIDDKLKTFNSMLKLASASKVPLIESLFASMMLESLMLRKFYDRGVVFIREKEEIISETYSGGYVEEPKVGYYEDVTIVDFASEFPSIMLYGNIGGDTIIGQTNDGGKTYVDFDGKVNIIDPQKHIVLDTNCVFTKEHGDSVLRETVGDLFTGRFKAKRTGKECEEDIKVLKELLKQM